MIKGPRFDLLNKTRKDGGKEEVYLTRGNQREKERFKLTSHLRRVNDGHGGADGQSRQELPGGLSGQGRRAALE